MKLKAYNELFLSDFNIDSIMSVHQYWLHNERFNFLSEGRRIHGLLLLTDAPAPVEYPSGEVVRYAAGNLLFVPKGARYAISFPTAAHPVLINFRLTRADGAEVWPDSGVYRLCRDDGSLLPLFSRAAQFYKNAQTARLKATVYELLDTLFPVAEEDECGLAYIGRHYTDRFSVPQLAARCALSETAYRKRFRQITGLSPVQYVNRLKVEKACQMLRSGDVGPRVISEFLGFYSVPYFYKVFGDITGQTPLAYRAAAGEKPAGR